jgi:cytochrome d ubiquinol oxidase subunit I
VPGITNIIEGGYPLPDGTTALPAKEKMARGKEAIDALAAYQTAKEEGNEAKAGEAKAKLDANMPYFGYGYIKDVNRLVPSVPLTFYAFRAMVILGCYFILFFIVVLFLVNKRDLSKMKWMHWVALITIPLGYLATQAGWIVAECGRQPWAIQDLLPVDAAISRLQTGSVQTTFFLFLILCAIMLIAEVMILLKAIKGGPGRN